MIYWNNIFVSEANIAASTAQIPAAAMLVLLVVGNSFESGRSREHNLAQLNIRV
jgi:hypothetical protein